MNEFIEKNRPLLHSYYVGARIIGWLLLITPLVSAVIKPLSGFSNANEQLRFYMICRFWEQIFLGFVLLGLVLLGLAQFVKYLYEREYQPGLLLRHGDKVLYLYALGQVASPILFYLFQIERHGYDGTVNLFLFLLSALMPAIARGLIFVGMAKVLKRMVPMVEESKTLV